MKIIANFLLMQLRYITIFSFADYLHYRFAPKGSTVKLCIHGHNITVRKGTPDLGVAISCLSGEFESLRYLFQKSFDGIIVDAGGYIGTATIALRAMFPKAKIIILEPSEHNIKVLRENIAELENVHLVQGALVGTRERTVRLNDRGTGEWGFTIVPDPLDNREAKNIQTVNAFRLCDLISENEKIGLLKLDIEGGELSLLEHDAEALSATDVVIAELHDRIVPGCLQKFLEFSSDRILVKDAGEKYLSIKR